MANPFTFILDNFYEENYSGMDAAAVLLLRVMADSYKGDMPLGTCADAYSWCLAQLDKYRPNEFLDWMNATDCGDLA